MCPMMKTFKKPLQNLISCLSEQQYSQIPLPDKVKSGLLTWWAFLKTNNTGLPIVRDVSSPPLCHKLLTTDVSDWKKDNSSPTKVCMGCAGLDEEGEIFFTSQHFWESDNSKNFLRFGIKVSRMLDTYIRICGDSDTVSVLPKASDESENRCESGQHRLSLCQGDRIFQN